MRKTLKTLIITSFITTGILGVFQFAGSAKAATATKSATTKATASPSISPSPSPTASPEQTAEELKRRIEKVVGEKKSTSEKTGFIGEVIRLSQEALTVKQASGTTIIPLENAITLIKKGKKITAQEVEVGNWVIVIGGKKDDGLVPDFIIVSSETLRPKAKAVVIGTITSLAKNKLTILTRGSNEEKSFSIVKTTSYENADGSPLKVTDFDKDLSVLVVGIQGENDTIDVTTIRALSDVKAATK